MTNAQIDKMTSELMDMTRILEREHNRALTKFEADRSLTNANKVQTLEAARVQLADTTKNLMAIRD